MAAAPTSGGAARARELEQQAEAWLPPSDPRELPLADHAEIPIIDLARWREAKQCGDSNSEDAERQKAAQLLRRANEEVGFYYLSNHGLPNSVVDRLFESSRLFHSLPPQEKLRYEMDVCQGAPKGTGYLPVANSKLPARTKANMNASFVVKREALPRGITLDKMPWPHSVPETGFDGTAFRDAVTDGCDALETLALSLLPLYATALDLVPHYFADAFSSPLYRLRLSHYPPTRAGDYGINPHVDTTFFTLLATTHPDGLVVYSRARDRWVRARSVSGALIVNTGETLARITNDRWLATRHYAVNPQITDGAGTPCDARTGDAAHQASDRYSLPFFFNPTADYRLAVVPTCCSEDMPAKYKPESYLEGQGVVQGE